MAFHWQKKKDFGSPIGDALISDRVWGDTYSNFWLKEVLESQRQTANHFSKEECVNAPLKYCN